MKSFLKRIFPGLNNNAMKDIEREQQKEYELAKEKAFMFGNQTIRNSIIPNTNYSMPSDSVNKFGHSYSSSTGASIIGSANTSSHYYDNSAANNIGIQSTGSMSQTWGSVGRKPSLNNSGINDSDRASTVVEYLRLKGVKYVNDETAKALSLNSNYIGLGMIKTEEVIKQPKKKLKF